MSQRFGSMYGRLCICEWCDQCCEISSEERKYFWRQIRKEQCRFCRPMRTNSQPNHHESGNLYSAKSYTWTLGDGVFFFKIGLNPRRGFRIQITLEDEKTHAYVELDTIIINELFSVIRDIYQANTCHPRLDSARNSNTEHVRITAYASGLYRISIKNQSMGMNDKNLLALIELQPWIAEILQIYELERVKAESSLFRLLNIFSKENKTMHRDELVELITAPCSYVPVGFIIEIATQNYDLLAYLLAVYQKTRTMFKAIPTTMKSKSAVSSNI